VAPDGTRLEKRTPRSTVGELRAAGVAPERIVGELAFGLGIAPTPEPVTSRELARASAGRDIVWRRDPWPIPGSLVDG
jgi:glutamyl-tRNA synthetase